MTQSFHDLNYSLKEYDSIIDVILSNLNVSQEELQKSNINKKQIVSQYYDILKFKIEVVYSLLIKLEELFFGTTFAYYRKYHNSITRELSVVEFESTKREASYIFDSFCSQYKSLLDLSIKFAFQFAVSDLQPIPEKIRIDSFEQMIEVLDFKDKSKYSRVYKFLDSLAKYGYFQSLIRVFFENKTSFQEIKHYRDYTIHHGFMQHQLKGKSSEGQVLFTYWIPRLSVAGKKYQIDPLSNQRLDYFCREKFSLLLRLISEMTDLMYSDDLRQPYIKNLGSLQPEQVKDILQKISGKGYWADHVVDEKELKKLLLAKGIDFNELVEDYNYSNVDNNKKGKKDDFLPHIEKLFYKPIGQISVFRTKTIFKMNDKGLPDKTSTPLYGITFSNITLQDYVSKNSHIAGVLDSLLRSGLVYLVNTEGETRYGSIRNDLKILVNTLKELSDFKWSFIQIPEMQYFRERTDEETENTRRLLVESADNYLKQENEERKRILAEYKIWKNNSSQFFENPIDVIDKNKEILARITHKEFVEEKNLNFKNWRANLRIEYIEKDGKTKSCLIPFFTNKNMDQQWLVKFIKQCERNWKGKPKHWLDFQKKWIKKSKKRYGANVKQVKVELASCIEKYSFLIPVFRLMNKDVFE